MMEVQHLFGFEATVIQNFLQIAAEEVGTKREKEKLHFRDLKPRAKEMNIMAPMWSFTIALKMFLHR